MAGTFNFVGDQAVEQGATCIWTFNIYSGEVLDPAFLVNLSGYIVRMMVRKTATSSTVIFEASTLDGKIVLDGINGKYTLTITATQSAALAAGSYIHQIELDNGSGAVQRLLQGTFVVDAEVVR